MARSYGICRGHLQPLYLLLRLVTTPVMQAAILSAPRRFDVQERDIPDPGPREVRVRAAICGMCTGEIEMWAGKVKDYEYPKFIGHEVSGVVDAIGDRVEDVAVGDRVTVFAEEKGYAEHVVVPARWVVKLAEETPFDLALGEPIACSVNGVRKVDPQLGDSVCLVGCGFMGLIMLQVFEARGTGLRIAVDVRDSALELARQLGATHTFNPRRDDVEEGVHALTGGNGVDIGVEAAGTQATLDLTTKLVRMEGTLEVFGFHQGGLREVDWAYWNWMAFRVVNGHTRNPDIYVEGMRLGIGLMERGGLDMEPLVTHRFRLDAINEGFAMAERKEDGFVKGVVAF